MKQQKNSAQTVATVRSANVTSQKQFTPNSGKTQDLDALLIAEVWDCALEILNDCSGNYVAAKREVSRLVHCAPIERRLKKWIRKMLRTAMYYQVTRNLRVTVRDLKKLFRGREDDVQ